MAFNSHSSVVLWFAIGLVGTFVPLALVTFVTLGWRLRDTTLLPAIVWGGVATVGIFGGALSALNDWYPLGSAERVNLRYLVGILTFCPFMTVLGARRPHHQAWQWIVVSLIAILALPVAESYVVQRGSPVKIQDARGIFLAGLIVAGFANYLPTRFCISAMCVSFMQLVLLSEHLPFWHRSGGVWDEIVATGAVVGAMLAGWLASQGKRAASLDDQAWIAYRNAFGAVWGLRMQERMNAYAVNYGWPFRLTWWGFRAHTEEKMVASYADHPVAIDETARRAWWSLLRRFVAPTWLPGTPMD